MSGKRPTDHLEPAAKKRGADRQITKDDDDVEDDQEHVEAGTFARADEATLKQRKIVKARRAPGGAAPASTNPFANVVLAPTATATAAPAAANPFANVNLVPTTAATAANGAEEGKKAEEETKPADAKDDGEGKKEEDAVKPAAAAPSTGGFGALAGSGTGLAFGSGFGGATGTGGFGSLASGTSTFGGFGAAAAAGPATGFSGFGSSAASASTFSFGATNTTSATATDDKNNNDGKKEGDNTTAAAPSVFGSASATGTALFGGSKPTPPAVELPTDVIVSTGEEEEETVFSGDGVLFEFDVAAQWKERGRGNIKVNVDRAKSQARLVMRNKGNLKLLLNANLWPEMQITTMEGGKGATFPCVNFVDSAEESEGDKNQPSSPAGDKPASVKVTTYAFRTKTSDVLDDFVNAVNAQKMLVKKHAS